MARASTGPVQAQSSRSFAVQSHASPSSGAQSAGRSSARQPYLSGQSQGDLRILQALNRFTFGARPGDIEAVRTVGLEKWFDRQLHPETLDETDLDGRLAQFPAMRRDPLDLLYYLPSNAVIRQTIDGKLPMPTPPELRAVYANEMARVEVKRQDKEKKQATLALAGSGPGAIMAPSMGTGAVVGSPAMDTGGVALPAREQALQQPNQMAMAAAADAQDPATDPALIAEALAMPAHQRVTKLAAMGQTDFDSFRKALKGPQRTGSVGGPGPCAEGVCSRAGESAAGGERRVGGAAADARHLFERAVAGNDDRFLAESL